MSGQHKHGDDGWVLGYEGDEDTTPAMDRHARRYGHEVTHHIEGNIFQRFRVGPEHCSGSQ